MLFYEIYIVNNTFRVFFHTVCASQNIFVKKWKIEMLAVID